MWRQSDHHPDPQPTDSCPSRQLRAVVGGALLRDGPVAPPASAPRREEAQRRAGRRLSGAPGAQWPSPAPGSGGTCRPLGGRRRRRRCRPVWRCRLRAAGCRPSAERLLFPLQRRQLRPGCCRTRAEPSKETARAARVSAPDRPAAPAHTGGRRRPAAAV